jgi:hypothetical protein
VLLEESWVLCHRASGLILNWIGGAIGTGAGVFATFQIVSTRPLVQVKMHHGGILILLAKRIAVTRVSTYSVLLCLSRWLI